MTDNEIRETMIIVAGLAMILAMLALALWIAVQ